MWLEYVGWLEKRNCKQQAAEVCERAAHAVPTCTALRLLHADILEALDNNDQAEESLERLILDVERQAVIESDVDRMFLRGQVQDDWFSSLEGMADGVSTPAQKTVTSQTPLKEALKRQSKRMPGRRSFMISWR